MNYFHRFYDRQFITRDTVNQGVLENFEILFHAYFSFEKPENIGLLSVANFAEALNLSANFLRDLIRKEAGISAQEYIQTNVIDIAKEKIFDHTNSINEIAYKLDFKYPQHFTRLFKLKTGMNPLEYWG